MSSRYVFVDMMGASKVYPCWARESLTSSPAFLGGSTLRLSGWASSWADAGPGPHSPSVRTTATPVCTAVRIIHPLIDRMRRYLLARGVLVAADKRPTAPFSQHI